MTRHRPRLKWIGVLILLVVFGIALSLYSLFHLNADWVPSATTAQLRGATADQVRQLLGAPTGVKQGDGDTWVYHRNDRLAEFQVWFGPDGRVEEWHYDR